MLCDIGLPADLDGHAVARAIRDDPSVSPARIIAVSGYGRDEDIRLSLEAGFDNHLTKPLDLRRSNELVAQRAQQGC